MFIEFLATKGIKHNKRLVGLCDNNPGRIAYYQSELTEKYGHSKVAEASPDTFEHMLREQKVHTVIVTTIDRNHDEYICRAMQAGCDVITEKPMTISTEKCQRILNLQKHTGRKITVTFNYRYAPRNSKVKQLIQSGVIGEVKSVHFEWLLSTQHGADYFRRWHRDKRNSGGLMVHKSTHHFDLVNWWIGARPKTVMAMGDLVFYGRANAEARGVQTFYTRGTGFTTAETDPFALDMNPGKNKFLADLYLHQEHHDAYLRDLSVFSDGISIEDDIGVLVRYTNNAVMTYHLTAFSPWEGYRVMFNGTKGRLESEVVEAPYVSGADEDHNMIRNVSGSSPYEVNEPATILLRPLWGKPQIIEVPEANEGGHGGGDQRLLSDIFLGGGCDPLGRAASHTDGAMSILPGIAANMSLASGRPVEVDGLISL